MMGGLLSTTALVGGLIGLFIGLLQYRVLARSVFPRIAEAQEARRERGEEDGYSLGAVKNAILISDLIIFPAIGYVAGPLVASALGWGGS